MAKNILVLSMCITLITVSSLYPHTYLSPPGAKGIIKKHLQMSDIELLIRNCDKENIKEIEDKILILLQEGEIILGLQGVFVLALHEYYNEATTIMLNLKNYLSFLAEDNLFAYDSKLTSQLRIFPPELKKTMEQLCQKYPAHAVALAKLSTDAFDSKLHVPSVPILEVIANSLAMHHHSEAFIKLYALLKQKRGAWRNPSLDILIQQYSTDAKKIFTSYQLPLAFVISISDDKHTGKFTIEISH